MDRSSAAFVNGFAAWGHAGVGQSSWGPTIFVAMPSLEAAEQLVAALKGDAPTAGTHDLAAVQSRWREIEVSATAAGEPS